MNLLLVGVVAAALAAVIVARKTRSGAAWAGPVAVLLILIAAALAATVLISRQKPYRSSPEREKNYGTVLGHVLGAYLVDHYEGSVLLIVPRGFGPEMFVEQAMVDALKEFGGGRIAWTGPVPLEVPAAYAEQVQQGLEDDEAFPGQVEMFLDHVEGWYTTRVLEDLVRGQPEAVDLVVSLAPLPVDFVRNARRLKDPWPPLVLLDPPIHNPDAVLRTGRVAALVAMKPLAEWKRIPVNMKDPAASFASRYRLMTPDRDEVNVRALMEGKP